MTGDNYLQEIVSKYEVDIYGAKAIGNEIFPIIQAWAGSYLIEAVFSGSIAKGTAVTLSTDADIFISLSSTTLTSLSEIYNSLYNAVSEKGYKVRKQNVSIGVTVNGYKIDLVPGKRQTQYGNDHSLFRNKANTWTKTNINTHISLIKNSGRLDEIKLTKIWRELNCIEWPSFYLEMVVIDALRNYRKGYLDKNFLRVLEYIRDSLVSARYIDPANTANIISDDLTATEKRKIAARAGQSRNNQHWSQIIW